MGKHKKESMDKAHYRILKLFRNSYFYYSLIFLLITILINSVSNYHVYLIQNHLPTLPDSILDNLPRFNIAYLYDLFLFASLIIFLIYVITDRKEDEIPYYLVLFGILQILRAFFIILNPIANPVNSYNSILSGKSFDYGTFFSGHSAATFLVFLLTLSKRFKWLLFFCFLGVIVTLFLSKGHYSMDIFAGIIFSYAVYSFGESKLKKYLNR